MGLDRLRFELRVPSLELLAPQLLREYLFGALEPLRDLALGWRDHAAVDEAVHVAVLERADQHPVEARELAEAANERLGVHLLPVQGRRTREMNRVDRP